MPKIVKTAFLAAKRAVIAASEGRPLLVREAEVAHRESLCKQCPRREESTNRCLECKCFLSLKVQLSTESCPLKKWGNDIDDSQNPKTS